MNGLEPVGGDLPALSVPVDVTGEVCIGFEGGGGRSLVRRIRIRRGAIVLESTRDLVLVDSVLLRQEW